jgi:hypothetical protein
MISITVQIGFFLVPMYHTLYIEEIPILNKISNPFKDYNNLNQGYKHSRKISRKNKNNKNKLK